MSGSEVSRPRVSVSVSVDGSGSLVTDTAGPLAGLRAGTDGTLWLRYEVLPASP